LISTRNTVIVDGRVDAVWADLADIESHPEWMVDVAAIRFIPPGGVQVGSSYEVDSRVGPFRLKDELEIVELQPGQTLAVRRNGAVSGEGRFTVEAVSAQQTRVTRSMMLGFPWWMGGAVGEVAAQPILRMLFQANLRAFAARHAAGR